jgi:hypothetical protein
MVAYLCDGYGAKNPALAVERSSKYTRPRVKGRGRQQKDRFLYVRSHQLVENKGRHIQNEAKTNLKRPPKAPRNALLCGIDAGFCDFRGVGWWGLHEGRI